MFQNSMEYKIDVTLVSRFLLYLPDSALDRVSGSKESTFFFARINVKFIKTSNNLCDGIFLGFRTLRSLRESFS